MTPDEQLFPETDGIPWVVLDYVGPRKNKTWYGKAWCALKWLYINLFCRGMGATLHRDEDGWWYHYKFYIRFEHCDGFHYKWTKEEGRWLLDEFERELASEQVPLDPKISRLIDENFGDLV